MTGNIKERLEHALLAILLSAGLAVPLCGALDASLISPRILWIAAGIILVFELVSLHRAASWTAAVLAVCGTAVWILSGDGARILSDTGIAVGLRLRGIRTAVPLAAEPISTVIAAGMTVLCCFAALRQVTCIPAVMLCTIVLMTVWLTDTMEMIPWLLPALSAVLALLMMYRYEDTPAMSVLPWAAGLTALAFLLAGAVPRDTPLKEKADEMRQAVLDRLFFTEARDVFSLYSVGLSPQGADQLGGKPNLSDTPVMQVSTPRTAYLRGTIYNWYNGHGWQNTTGGRRYLWQSRRMEDIRSQLFDEAKPPASIQNSLSDPSVVSVRMLSGSASTLFVPQRIRELNPGGETVPYFSYSSEVFITRNLQAGDTWEVSAPLYTSVDPGIGSLTDICAMLEDPDWEKIRSTYTELPSHLEQPVRDIAAEVTAHARTPYEKAMALQNYLTRNFRYTLNVGEHPENIDFVTSFLLDTKKGYCTYFASAMTVLCRMAGLPARYVEGYLAEPNAQGEALVTGMDAHAWTEVYFSGFGWLTFDATPGRRSSGGGSGRNSPTPTPSPEPDPTPTPESETDPPEPSDPETDAAETPTPAPSDPPAAPPSGPPPEATDDPDNPPENPDRGSFPWWILLILAALAGGTVRMLTTSPAYRAKRSGKETERFDIWAEEIARLLRAERMTRNSGETVMGFARRVDAAGLFSESVTPAGECLSLIRYSGAAPAEADTALLRDTAMLVRGEMTKQAKIRYLTDRLIHGGSPLKRRRHHPGQRRSGGK